MSEAAHELPDDLPEDETEIYGQHLTLRLAKIENLQFLDSPILIGRFLTTLVARIGMTVLQGPLLGTENGPEQRYGHSGIVILVESHCAVHTYPAFGELFLDVFSCKRFALDPVFKVCAEFFGGFEVRESVLLDRGHHWGQNAAEELTRWMSR